MVQQIGEHSYDPYWLRKGSNILDIGCRGFEFRNHFNKQNVYSIDIDDLDDENYYPVAISDKDGWTGVKQDGQATRITEGNEIQKMTLKTFSEFVNVSHWDLIKMDIEGEEVKVLKSLTHPYCKQISVEFHAHCGQTKDELDNLLDWLSEWYVIYNRVWEQRHCAGYNYWDILLIAK